MSRTQEGVAVAALHHPIIGSIDFAWGNDKYGLMKIMFKHPEVVDNLQELIEKMPIVQQSDNRIILETDTHRAVISKKKGKEATPNWLLTAYEKKRKNVLSGSSDIYFEPNGLQNGTAPLQNPQSFNKDSEVVDTDREKSVKESEESVSEAKEEVKPSSEKNAPKDSRYSLKGSEKPGLVRDEYTATLPNADWIDGVAPAEGEQPQTNETEGTPVETAQPQGGVVEETAEEVVTGQPKTALERIPTDEQGKKAFEKAESPKVAYDALMEASDNDAEIAESVINAKIEEKEKAVKDLEKKKVTAKSNDPLDLVAAAKEKKAMIAQAQSEVDFWKGVQAAKDAPVVETAEEVVEEPTAEEVAEEVAETSVAEETTTDKNAEMSLKDSEESGFFGPVYRQFKGKVKEAINFLLKHKTGDLLAVFHRDGFGDIDLVWGDETGGLAHIVDKHINSKDFKSIEELAPSIEDIIKNGSIVFENGDKVVFSKNGYQAIIRKNIRKGGKKIADKNWVLTAYNKEEPADTLAPAANDKGSTAVASGSSEDKGSKVDGPSKEKSVKESEGSVSEAKEEATPSSEKNAPKDSRQSVKGSEKPGLVRDEYTATLPNADWIDKLAKRLGLTVEFVPAEEVNNGDSNAMIVGNNVKIARSGTDRGLRFLTGHEFTHHMQDVSPKAYHSFKKAVKKAMGNRYYEAVANTEANYRRHGIVIPLSQAEDEVVADYAGSLVQDAAEVERFINGMTPNRSLIEKIIDALKHLRDFFTDRDIYNLENAIKKFENMLSDSEAQVTRLDPELQNVEMKNEDVVASVDKKHGQALFSLKTYEAEGRARLEAFLNDRVAHKALTKAEADDIRSNLEHMYDICNKYRDQYGPFGKWSDAQVIIDEDGNPVFSVIKANGEYAMNLDFSLVCKKRRTLDAVFNEMIDRGIMQGMPLTQENIAKVNDIIRRHGFETACRLCFVDAKRFRVAKVADDFCNMYNSIVKAMIPKDSGIQADYFNFGNADVESVERPLNTIPDEELNIQALRDIISREKTPGTTRAKIAQHLIDNPKDRRLTMRSDFMSTVGFDKAKEEGAEVLKLYNAKKGSGGPKSSFSDVQYLNDIIDANWDAEKAYEVGGVRVQSFSDFVPRMVFDYIQMVGDLAAKRLPVHAYTKEELFAKMFGLTGIKINMSLVPAVVEGGIAPGLDADGNYVWQIGESFDYDTAVAIQNAEGYRENCGTIAVGISDAHIRKLLADPNIRMVIPYHKSGINHAVAVHNNIDKFHDYTKTQNTRYKDSGKKLSKEDMKNEPNYNVLLQETGSPRKAAQKYLDWCEQNNYIPKFDQFAYNEDGTMNENYYKVLEDFTVLVPNGKGVEYFAQRGVETEFPTANNAFGSMESLIKRGLEEDAILEGRRTENIPQIVDEIEDELMPNNPNKDASPGIGERYSLKADNSLAGIHNISGEKLRKALKMGGLANPSTAVIDVDKQDFDKYGEISLILPSSMVDKKTGRNSGTYFGDAWTPTYPQIERRLSEKMWKKYDKRLADSVEDDGLRRFIRQYYNNYLEGGTSGKQHFLFLKEKGIEPEVVRKSVSGTNQGSESGAIDQYRTVRAAEEYVQDNNLEDEYSQWLEDLTESLEPEEVFWAGTDSHGRNIYRENTLENVSRHMKKEGKTNSYDNSGLSATKASLLQKANTLKAIRSGKGRLSTDEEYKKVYDKLSDKLFAIIEELAGMEKLSDNQFIANDYAELRLQDAFTKRDPVGYLNSEYGYKISPDSEFAKKLTEFIGEASTMPAAYFETKFERPVYLEEFSAAVVPNNLDGDLKTALKDSGLDVYEYEQGNKESRREATQKATQKEGVRFSLKAMDNEYMQAVESGNMDKAQQMVNQRADMMLDEFSRLQDDSDIVGFKYHRGKEPKKVKTMYAVFNVSEDGFRAAYAGNKTATPVGVWLDAQMLDSYKSDKTQFRNGEWASYIPGDTGFNWKDKFSPELYEQMGFGKGQRWLLKRGGKHGSDVPNFAQMNVKNPETGERSYGLPHNKLIFEIEVAADEDLTDFVKEKGRVDVGGKNQGLTEIKPNQFYFFKTNPNANGNWGIAGTFRIKRLVPYEEVEAKTKEANDKIKEHNKNAQAKDRIKEIPLQKWVGGYKPEDFGLSVESVDQMYREGKSKKMMDAVTYDDNGNVIPLSERFNENKQDARYSLKKPFGGNRGYVGYSMSVRAAEAREEDRYPKTDFKKVYKIPDSTLTILTSYHFISNAEWHHTSVYGNKTKFYGWNEPYFAEAYAENKKEIDRLAKIGNSEAIGEIEDLFENSEAAKVYKENEEIERIEEKLRDIEYDRHIKIREIYNAEKQAEFDNEKAVVSKMDEDGVIKDGVFTASNGVKIRVNNYGVETQMQYPEGRKNKFNRDLARSEYEAAKSATRSEMLNDGSLTPIDYSEYDRRKAEVIEEYEKRRAEVFEELEKRRAEIESRRAVSEANPRYSLKEGISLSAEDFATMRSEAEQLADELHTPVRIVEDVEEISDGNERVQAMKRRARGWYDVNTGEVVIVLPNADNAADARETVFHEVVAHKGLRELLGGSCFERRRHGGYVRQRVRPYSGKSTCKKW